MTKTECNPRVGERRWLVEVGLEPPKDKYGDSDMDRQQFVTRIVPTIEEARKLAQELTNKHHHGGTINPVEWTNEYGDDGEYDPRYKCQWQTAGSESDQEFFEAE